MSKETISEVMTEKVKSVQKSPKTLMAEMQKDETEKKPSVSSCDEPDEDLPVVEPLIEKVLPKHGVTEASINTLLKQRKSQAII